MSRTIVAFSPLGFEEVEEEVGLKEDWGFGEVEEGFGGFEVVFGVESEVEMDLEEDVDVEEVVESEGVEVEVDFNCASILALIPSSREEICDCMIESAVFREVRFECLS